MLGIIIGIGAIIATLAIGRGAEEKTRQKFLAMGNNYISLHAGNWLQEGKTSMKKRKRAPEFKERDAVLFKKLIPTIKYISPYVGTREVVKYKTNSIIVKIKGGNQDFAKVLNRKIAIGTFYSKSHAKRGARVAILGMKSATELFNSTNPIGKVIKIKDIPFVVIGVLRKIEQYSGVQDPNFDILMPIRSIKKHIFNTSRKFVNSIVLSAPTQKSIPFLAHQLKKLLRFRRKIKEGMADDFTIWDQASIMKAAQAAATTIRLLLLIIASISLLVGGIGIMNIMLVSVTERTREIGIRMALGAGGHIILKQFLIEALTLCFIGGIIGIALGIAVPHGIAHLTSWNPIITINSIIIAFVTTSIIGVFFGFYPAFKASKLNPVDALAER
jgi:putative ABC transport system permease protein